MWADMGETMNARALFRGPAHVLVAATEGIPEPFPSSIGQPAREICARADCPVSDAMDRAWRTGQTQHVEGYDVIPVSVGGEMWGVALVLAPASQLRARRSMRDLLDLTAPVLVAVAAAFVSLT